MLTWTFAVVAYLVFALPLALVHAWSARRRLRASGPALDFAMSIRRR